MHKVLFVCTGNICRSPTAEGVLRHHLEKEQLCEKIMTDSAGTHNYHVGEAPDRRSIAAAKRRGISIDTLRARKIEPDDFYTFDTILACDRGHYEWLKRIAPKDSTAQLELFLDYADMKEKEVPDPYYGSTHDFEYVLDLVENAVPTLIQKLKSQI